MRRPVAMTRQPALAKRCTAALPKPDVAPVINMVLVMACLYVADSGRWLYRRRCAWLVGVKTIAACGHGVGSFGADGPVINGF